MSGNFSGGSFSGAVGGFSVDQVAVATATPGLIRHLGLKAQFKVEDEAEKLARRIREGTIVQPVSKPAIHEQSARYSKKMAKVTAGISKLRDEARTYRTAIARLEKSKETATARRQLLRAQQALQLATVQETVLMEEMEVADIAFFAAVAMAQQEALAVEETEIIDVAFLSVAALKVYLQ